MSCLSSVTCTPVTHELLPHNLEELLPPYAFFFFPFFFFFSFALFFFLFPLHHLSLNFVNSYLVRGHQRGLAICSVRIMLWDWTQRVKEYANGCGRVRRVSACKG